MQPAATVAAAAEPAGGAVAAFSATAAAAAQVTVGWLCSTASPALAQILGLQPDITAAQPAGQLQQHRQVPGPAASQHAPPQLQHQLAGHGAAAAVGGGGLLAMLHETSESAAAVYTETLRPAGELLWQLVLGASGLLAAVVVYVLLPLLRGSIRASRYLLLKLNRVLMPCRQRLQQIWSSRLGAPSAAETAPAGTSTPAADEHAVQGVAGPGSAVLEALPPAVALPPADGSPSPHAPTDQQNLLQFAQQRLARTCRQQQGFLLDLQQLSNSSSSSFTADSSRLSWLRTADKLSPDAGYGSCAYRAVLAQVPVVLQLYRIATLQDAELFAQSFHSLCSVHDSRLLPCQGATFALVPADCCPQVNAAAIPRSVQPTAGSVPAQQQPQQPMGVVVAFVVAVPLIEHSSGLLASLHEAALPDRPQQQQRNSVAPASADAPVAGGGSSRHSTSTVCRIGGSSSSTHTAGLQSWSIRLQLAPEVAAAVHQLYTTLTAAGTNSTWLNGVTGEQLAAALVVDLAAHRMQMKLNPAVLLLGALQRGHARDSRHHHSVANAGLLAAVGDVLLLLATAEPHGARPSSSSSSHPTTVDQVQCVIRARLSAEGVASDDEVALVTDQLAKLVIALWQQSSPPQQQPGKQQQQQVHDQQQESQQTGRHQPTYSVAAAEGLPQHTSWFGWMLGRLRSKTPRFEQPSTSTPNESLTHNNSSRPATNNATEQDRTRHDAGTAAPAAANQSGRASVGQVDSTGQTLNFDWIQSLQQVADKAAAWQAQQLERQQALAAAAAAAEAAARRSRASEPPAWFICPITSSIMVDPVVAADGHTYERAVISHWLQVARVPRSPMTNQVMQPTLVPNHVIRSAIMEWKQQHIT